jgi:hypothetical protein
MNCYNNADRGLAGQFHKEENGDVVQKAMAKNGNFKVGSITVHVLSCSLM